MSEEHKIFVGGLAWATDDARLNDAFSQYGEIAEAKVIMDRETGRSRGFGFVTFTTSEAVTEAIEMNGQDLDGRQIRVDRAQSRQNRGGGGGGGGGGYGGGGGGGGYGGGGGGGRY